MHPNINERPAPVHPCRIRISEVDDMQKDLAQLLNKVQRHSKCSDGYCIRYNKKTKSKGCRFKFPKALQEATHLVLNENNQFELVTERNDPLLNNYNPYILQTWRANIDFTPVLSKQALINYLAKYISKPEKESKQLIDILRYLLQETDDDKLVKSIIQRLYIQCCSERDYSTQETCHLISGRKLYSSGGRNFITVNFSRKSGEWIFIPQDNRKQPKTIFEKYKDRAVQYENECLCYMAKNFNLSTGVKYAKEVILQIYPKCQIKPGDEDQNEFYYRQQVLLYIPWRHEEDFIQHELQWKDVYDANIELIKSNSLVKCTLAALSPEDSEFENNIDTDEDYYSVEEWMTISKMGPGQILEEVELGRRDIDLSYDWHAPLQKYESLGGIPYLSTFIQLAKEQRTTTSAVPISPPNVVFSPEQQSVLELLKLQLRSINETQFSPNFLLPKRIIVQGRAGTGKSLVIHAMTYEIYTHLGEASYIIMTPTGVSAKNVNGSTYHSALHINSKAKDFGPLKGQASHNIQKKLEKIRFLLIDEYSMIGCNAMRMIEQRIQEAKGITGEDFSSCFVYLFGDAKQLAPVADTPVYSDKVLSSERLRGKLIFDNFQGVIVLKTIHRQKDTSFQQVLNNIGDGTVSIADYEILKQRFSTNVSNEERLLFLDAVHLYSTQLEVLHHNRLRLENLRDDNNCLRPIARIPSVHNCKSASNGTVDDAEGLPPVLYLSKSVIICKLDVYDVPSVDGLVPIIPVTKSWKDKSGQSCTRTQFPLTLCFACCIHKSQSLSLRKAYVNIGEKEMSTGISYVGISRVRSLEGLLLEPFSSKRVLDLNKKDSIKKRNEWLQKLEDRGVLNDCFLV
ncbi:hypothetical protein KUF71_010151 [Frankliniella fusca]|uniref:ATP-dependent DNA helicase n=1 Tax=Frankliniella fusca TaxID=407009 RepID=A0AAE1LJJ5_9NEOP|nr:hypothetical protein KUF71_010151 [Frankliniella fusca]